MASILAEQSALAQRQEAFLFDSARAAGRWQHVYYYLAARGDMEALFRHAPGEAGPAADRAYSLLLTGAANERDLAPLETLAEEAADPWVTFSLTKIALQREDWTAAVRIAARALKRKQLDTSPLNLVARMALHTEAWDMAAAVARRSLAIAPNQREVHGLLNHARERIACPQPRLDVAPLRARVAFYVPCYNVEQYIARAIEGILSQSYPIQEILIIDDASPDRAAEAAAAYPVRIQRHTENLGLAAARNTAWRACEMEFIGAIDTDAAPEPGFTQYALMEFEQHGPEFAAAGGRLIEQYTGTPPDLWRSIHLSQDPGAIRWYMDTRPPDATGLTEEEVNLYFSDMCFLAGSNVLIRRAALEAAGGYDPVRRTNAEDVRLFREFRALGLHYAFTPNCVAVHARRDTPQSLMKTVWNYPYWGRVERGYFESPEKMLGSWSDFCLLAYLKTMYDLEQKREGLYCLDLLFLFSSLCLDLHHARAEGLLDTGRAAQLQEAVFAVAAWLDAEHGAAFEPRLRADLATWMLPPDTPAAPLGEALEAALEEQLGELRAVLDEKVPAMYPLALRAERKPRAAKLPPGTSP